MNNFDSEKVKLCWEKIQGTKGADAFVDIFYQSLFSNYPEVQSIFPEDLNKQKIILLSTLDNVINGIDYIDALERDLKNLGERHKNLGVTKQQYSAFIFSIIEAANIASNNTISKDEISAWEKAFSEISNIMLDVY